MHTLIPTDEGFLAVSDTTIARWNGSAATSLGTDSTYADPMQHAYHSDLVLLVNGAMAPSSVSGGTITALTLTGITDEEELIGVTVFKGRAYYWKNEGGFYFASAGAYQGALSYFDVSGYSSGNILFCFTYSTDAGDGTDDLFVAALDSGECLVFQGNDPGDTEAWELISKYRMPPPLGRRAHCDFVGDHVILTKQGWLNFDHVVKNGNKPGGVGHKITELAREAVSIGTDTDLWEAHYIANKGLLIVTTLQEGDYIQHVMNVLTGAWCTFSGFDSYVWAVKDGDGFYGQDNTIYQYGTYCDTVRTDAVPAYTQLGSDGLQRQVTALRPVTNIDPQTIGLDAVGEFEAPTKPTPSLDGNSGSVGGQWRSINRFAYNLTYRMTTETAGYEKRWYSTQIMYKQGGPA